MADFLVLGRGLYYQVNTLFGWADVANADKHAERLQEFIQTDANDACVLSLSRDEQPLNLIMLSSRVDYLESSLLRAGLTPFLQTYKYRRVEVSFDGQEVVAP